MTIPVRSCSHGHDLGILQANTVSVSRDDHEHGTHSVSSYVADYRAGGQSMAGTLRTNVAKRNPDLLDREEDADK